MSDKIMNNYKLSIILPSKNNFCLLQEWFSKVSIQESFSKVKVYILLSNKATDSNESFDLLIKLFSNVFIINYDFNYTMEDKVRDISSKIETDYVYLCGDGVIPNINRIYNLLVKTNCDILFLVNKNTPFFKVYKKNKNYKTFDNKLFYFLTFSGGSVVKRCLFNFNFQPTFKSNFLYPVAILNNLPENYYIQWLIGDDIYYTNPLKKRSTWMNSNDVVEIWTVNYVKSIFLLSNRYDSIKPLLIKNNDDKKFTIKALGIYKTIGCFDINVFRKYSGYYRMCGHSYLNIIIVYLIPTLVFKILFKIISIMKGLWKEKL